jgi:hypothetical protein
MAQHDYIISNQTFPNTRADLNDVLQAIATCNKGSSAPTTQYAGQMWIDDSAGTTWTLYLYDGSDNIQVATIDTTANTINFIDSVVSGFDIVTDTTPQLGGTLDTNGNPIQFADNVKAQFGTGNDLEIYHSGAGALITNNTGTLYVRASEDDKDIRLQSDDGVGGLVDYVFVDGSTGSTKLLNYGNEKLATTSTGIEVSGKGIFSANNNGNAQANYIRINDTDTTATLDNPQGGIEFYTNDSGNEGITASIINLYAGSGAGSNLTFNTAYNGATGAVERMRIDYQGNAIFKYGALLEEGTLTDGATIAWDVNASPVAKVTLGGNRTISAPSNSVGSGQFISLLVIQDGTGSRTLTWNAVYEFKDDTAPTLTTTASKGDVFVFRYHGSKWLEVGRNQNLTLS